MLQLLTIQNFAIVKQLEIEWHNGMTTITGETGAGKSIAIDALGLCLGERATTNVVRPGSKKTDISVTFDISRNINALNWLKQQELSGDNECILRRVITAEGRSSAFINGCKVPLIQLKEISSYLINIHGQHDHQLIAKGTEQLKIVDQYADHPDLLEQVAYQFKKWRQLTSELDTLQTNKQQREATKQLLQYQVSELDEFGLQVDEFELLEQNYQRQSNGQQLLSDTLEAVMLLSEDEQFNVLDKLNQVSDSIEKLQHVDPKLKNIATMLADAQAQLQEASADLNRYHQQLELDPEAFAIIEERYSLAIQLAKKHQVKPEQLAQYHLQLSQQLNALSNDDIRVESIIEELNQCEQNYYEAAKALSDSRKKAALTLNTKISQSMHELNMPNGKFCVDIQSIDENDTVNKISANGIDKVSFLVSMNPGQALEPMTKVASGGELSRISLAMQVVLAEKISSPSMIFDEVDVGISGPTAALVGNKLQQLGNSTQVICVTHLPQVASKGHQQLFVSKLTDGCQTETRVTELNEQSRVREIARLLAGDKITEHSLANAAELLAS